MKKIHYLFCIAMMTIATMTLTTACGGDDEDRPFVDNNDHPITAVHKIIIRVSGDTDNFKWRANFTALEWDGSKAKATDVFDEKGKILPQIVENFSYLSAETNKNGTTMATAMLVSDKVENNTGVLTVKYEGYLNGKMTNSKTFVIQGGKEVVQTIAFTSMPTSE